MLTSHKVHSQQAPPRAVRGSRGSAPYLDPMPDPVTPPVPEPLPLYQTVGLQERNVLSDPLAARKALTELLNEAREAQDRRSEAYILCLLGGAAFFQGNYGDTMLFAEYGLHLSQHQGLPELEARCLNGLGLACMRQGSYDEGLAYYRRSLDVSEQQGDDAGRARTLINLAAAYSELDAHEHALELYREGAELAGQCQALPYRADAYRGMIEELRHLDRAGEALALMPQATELADLVAFRSIQWKLRRCEALIALEDRRLKDALDSARLGMRVAKVTNDYEGLAVMRTLLGECLLNLAEYDQALTELRKGERLAQAIGLTRVYSRATRLLAKLYEIQGDAHQALHHLKIHAELEAERHRASSQMRSRAMQDELLGEVQRHARQLHREQREQREELSSVQQQLDQARDELLHLAAHDPLTGLHNRSSFWWLAQHHLTANLAGDAPLTGLILADVNELRALNDLYGHAAGDAALQEIARRLLEAAAPQDIVGRLNGDEFVLLVTRPGDEETLRAFTQELSVRLASPVKCGDVWVEAGVSIGYAAGPQDGHDIATLHRNAELALAAAKQTPHRPLARFDQELVAEEQARRQLRAELPQALRQGQFTLHYQAQYRLADQQLTGFESLIRWEHPLLGRVSPAQFIALAEQSGLILDLGTWILREACRQASEWSFPALNLSMAVNISPVQFSQPDFAELVQRVLEEFGLPGSCLTLEVTEGLVQRNLEASAATSRRLRALGVRVALDDFGSGHSSLNVLNLFPLDILKIDRVFMADLLPGHPDFARARQLMSAMVTLAHTLGLQVVAEGVESLSQLGVLEELGCNGAQGYALAQPSAAPDVAFRLPALASAPSSETTLP